MPDCAFAACLGDKEAAVACCAGQGAFVRRLLRIVIGADRIIGADSSRSSACPTIEAIRGASAISPPSVPCAPADAV